MLIAAPQSVINCIEGARLVDVDMKAVPAAELGVSALPLSQPVHAQLPDGFNCRVHASCFQEATKFCRHACRRRLECQDVNHALQVRDMEQMYGFTSSDRRRYSQVAGAPEAFKLNDTLHRCEDVINRDLPPTPVDAGLQMHWFLVNGIKPRIPENEVPRELIQWHQDKVQLPSPLYCQTQPMGCLLYTSPSPRDRTRSRMPSSA